MVAQRGARPGMSRVKILLIAVGALVGILGIAFLVQVWGYYRLIRNGDAALLDALSFGDRLTVSETSAAVPQPDSGTEVEIASVDDPVLGNATAPIEAVVFSDFDCPFSRESSEALREVSARFPDAITVQYRDFPLDDIHPDAVRAAIAAECADAQGKYWAMHDKLFATQGAHGEADMARYAAEVGLDVAEFTRCVADPANAAEVLEDLGAGVNAGVRGTPTFFVNGIRIEGAIPRETWEEIASIVIQP